MNKHFLSLLAGAVMAAAMALPWAASAQAQAEATGGDHIVVPLSHPSQPATLKVSVLDGSITVRAGAGGQVVVESEAGEHHSRHERPVPPEAEGMHQLTINPGLTAEEDNNVVTVRTSIFNGGGGNLDIQVPIHTSLNLHNTNGSQITIAGVDGDLSLDSTNGDITLTQVSGSIVAHALNGNIRASVARLDADKPSSFSSLNGTIDVTLPADVHADVQMKTDHGDIFMDNGFNFQVGRAAASADSGSGQRDANGMFRVRIDRSIYGTLNGGGPEIRFENFNGNIYVRKAK